MLKKCDILCIQEHWLLSFEGKELGEMFPEHNFRIKCIDDHEPAFPKMRGRGSAGTAILWKQHLDHIIEPLSDGSDRLLAIKIYASNHPTLLLNTYMPTCGSTQAAYDDTLGEVAEMMDKYSECEVVWTGDINADPNRSKPSANDSKFKRFCSEYNLQVSPHMPNTPTYYHFRRNTNSQLDMFIHSASSNVIKSIKVHSHEALNLSPHDPVSAVMHMQVSAQKTSGKSIGKRAKPSVRWDKVDKVQYRDDTDIKLRPLAESLDNLPASIITERLNKILSNCANEACPPPPSRKRKTKYRWSSNFKPLACKVKEAYKTYCQAKQTVQETEKLATLRAAKKLLRKAQRQAAASRRKDITCAIIVSCQKNNKEEFHKLIKRQRQHNKRQVNVEFKEHTKETVASSWASYFKELATPMRMIPHLIVTMNDTCRQTTFSST